MRNRLYLLPMLAALALSACGGPPQPAPTAAVAPYPAPPPARAEDIPKPPVSEEPLIWQPGHWNWDGNGYTWEHGDWIKRAGHGTQWQDGYWRTVSGTWVWNPGHWM